MCGQGSYDPLHFVEVVWQHSAQGSGKGEEYGSLELFEGL